MRRGMVTVVLATIACSRGTPTAVPIDVPAGQSFELAIGQSARFTAPAATITLLDVPEDSRCPVGSLVQCIWAGNGRIRVEVVQSGRADTLSLNTTLDPKQVDVGTVRVQFTALSPDASLSPPVAKTNYRAKLVVTGRAD